MLVQLSCVSRHYKDKKRENRRADITACLSTNINSFRRQGQVVEGKKKGYKEIAAKKKKNLYRPKHLPLQPRQR